METTELKLLLLQTVDFVLNGSSVCDLTGQEFQKSEESLVDRVTAFYQRQYGGTANSPSLGAVRLDRRSVKDSLGHGIGSRKAAAFAAVHDVIEKGMAFDVQENWKNRGYGTVVIAAPIRIAQEPYVCEVVVKSEREGKAFYLHEVNLTEKIADTIKTATGAAASAIVARPTRSILAEKCSAVNLTGDDFRWILSKWNMRKSQRDAGGVVM